MSITNAIEFHLEIHPRDPETIRLLPRALEAFVKSRGIDRGAAGFARRLSALLHYET